METKEFCTLFDEVCHETQAKYTQRLEDLKNLASIAHKNYKARQLLERALQAIEYKLDPDSVELFKIYYFEGNRKSRELSEQYFITIRTLFHRNKRILKAIMPVIFGVDGILFE